MGLFNVTYKHTIGTYSALEITFSSNIINVDHDRLLWQDSTDTNKFYSFSLVDVNLNQGDIRNNTDVINDLEQLLIDSQEFVVIEKTGNSIKFRNIEDILGHVFSNARIISSTNDTVDPSPFIFTVTQIEF